MLIIYSVLYLGTLNKELTICRYNSHGDFIGGQSGCYNLVPVFDWIRRCIVSIFMVFFIAFLPLFLQGLSSDYSISHSLTSTLVELCERGTGSALVRLAKHFLSLSPVFEVFSTQIYTNSILSNLTFGGARYIATGRGFATTRISFAILYSRFAGPSIYMGMRILLMLLYVTMALWLPHLIYFWVSVMALCIAPFVFNPHQFSVADFIIDYREFLRWMSRGNSRSHANSWIGYCRLSRTQITGFKKKRLGHPSEKLTGDVPRATWGTVIISEILLPIISATIFVVAYMFVKSFPTPQSGNVSPLIRLAVVSIGPTAWNALVLVVLFFISVFFGPVLNGCCARFPAVQAAIAHGLALFGK